MERSINTGVGNTIGDGKSSPHQSENTLKKSNLNVSTQYDILVFTHKYRKHKKYAAEETK